MCIFCVCSHVRSVPRPFHLSDATPAGRLCASNSSIEPASKMILTNSATSREEPRYPRGTRLPGTPLLIAGLTQPEARSLQLSWYCLQQFCERLVTQFCNVSSNFSRLIRILSETDLEQEGGPSATSTFSTILIWFTLPSTIGSLSPQRSTMNAGDSEGIMLIWIVSVRRL